MKIKIVKCNNPDCWYSKEIGNTFDVIKETPTMGFLVKKNTTINFYVDKEDCVKIIKK